MGLPVLILGESGTGKSASLRKFPSDKVAVINVAGKPLPFKNKIQSETTDDYMKIEGHIKTLVKQDCKSIVVDDAQYLMANEFMRRATERGFDKFTDIAKNFWSLVNMVKELPSDVIVYFLSHIERDQNGNEKIKTIGKLLDEKITVEGMFTIVLKTNVTDGVYSFLTQNNGHDTVKSPIDMFSSYAIDNDLHYVDQKIRNYYEMGECLTDEEIVEMDKNVENKDVTKESTQEKKGRRSRKKSEAAETHKGEPTDRGSVSEGTSEGASSETEEKPKRRTRRHAESESTDEAMNSPEEEKPKRTRKIREEESAEASEEPEFIEEEPTRRRSRKAQVEEAIKAIESEIASCGVDESGEKEEISFEEAPQAPVPETPRRRRRKVND